MATLEFEKTGISTQYTLDLKDNYSILWVESRTADMYRVLFATIADVLKHNQSKDLNKLGFKMKDDKGHFKLGAILTYKKPEEGSEEDSGNWYLEFTLYEEDMNDIEKELDNLSDVFVRCAAMNANTHMYGKFRSTELMYTLFNTAIDVLVSYLDTNASETDEVGVNLRGVFTASVAIEDGQKFMSIVPGEYIKQLIKNDAVL